MFHDCHSAKTCLTYDTLTRNARLPFHTTWTITSSLDEEPLTVARSNRQCQQRSNCRASSNHVLRDKDERLSFRHINGSAGRTAGGLTMVGLYGAAPASVPPNLSSKRPAVRGPIKPYEDPPHTMSTADSLEPQI